MSCEIKWALNKMPKTEDKNLPIMSVVEVKKARTFHESIPQYQVTPLADLKNMAEYLGLAKACVKDESYRFGLNAFKVLGGSSMPSPDTLQKRQNATSARCLTACSHPRSFATSSARPPFSLQQTETTAGALPGPPAVLARNALSACLWAPLRTGAATLRTRALSVPLRR